MAPARKKKAPSKKSINDAVKIIDKAIMAMKRKQYPKAKDILEDLKKEYSEDLEIRGKILTLLKICEKRIDANEAVPAVNAKSSEMEFYNHGIFLHNSLEYKEALECFEAGLKKSKENQDFFFYAMAATKACMGNLPKAAETLNKAIDISRENLYRAQNDPNFSALREDTEIWETVDLPENEEEPEPAD